MLTAGQIDSAFQLTEHLKALHNFLTHPVGSNGTIAVDRDMGYKLAEPPENVDRTLWLYELCRFLIQKVNLIIVALFSDNPPCSSITCPEMRASEWQYLCAVHDPPKSCCAIDYCCHTLDWAANTLTSPKHFPSRLALGSDQSTQNSQGRQLTNIFRRVYRIFAHAWFQHRKMFWEVEGRTGLYTFYKAVCDYYSLVPEDNYTIPAEAEGIEPTADTRSSIPPVILKREPEGPGAEEDNSTIIEGLTDHTLSTAGTTKRHRHSPSVGATAVSTVVEEENEEEEERPSLQPRPITQIFESTPEDDDEEQSTEPEEPIANDKVVEESVSAASQTPDSVEEPEKQSASVSAKADPAPVSEEKQVEGSAAVNPPGDETDALSISSAVLDSEKDTTDTAKAPVAGESEVATAGAGKSEQETTPAIEAEEKSNIDKD